MKKSFALMILVTIPLLLSCNRRVKELKPEKNTSPNQNPIAEKFDYQSFKDETLVGRILPNGNKIIDASFYMDEEIFGCSQTEVPPFPHHCQTIYKEYYSNLNLKSKNTSFGYVRTGISEYYGEDGHLIETVNENKKFEDVKITPEKFIDLMIEYKLLDKEILNTVPENYDAFRFGIRYHFDIYFSDATESLDGRGGWTLFFGCSYLPDSETPGKNITSITIDALDGLIVDWDPNEIPQDLHYLKKYSKEKPPAKKTNTILR